MITSLDAASRNFLIGINQIQQRSARAQQELTTGLKINSVSDSPEEVPLLMHINAQLDQTQQINTNLNLVKNEVDSGESSLQSAVTLLEKAQSLAAQGNTAYYSADSRKQLAGQVEDIMQQVVNIANTSSGGRFLFSGDTDQTQPYSIDLTQTNPISAYSGSASTRQIQGPDGSTFPVALTAQTIFDSGDPSTNVFEALNTLRNALLNNDQSGIDAVLPTLKSADTYLNSQLSFYGNTQDQVASGMNFGANMITQLKTQLAGVQDADAAQSIMDLTQAQNQQQAALTSFAKIPRSSLFNYLG